MHLYHKNGMQRSGHLCFILQVRVPRASARHMLTLALTEVRVAARTRRSPAPAPLGRPRVPRAGVKTAPTTFSAPLLHPPRRSVSPAPRTRARSAQVRRLASVPRQFVARAPSGRRIKAALRRRCLLALRYVALRRRAVGRAHQPARSALFAPSRPMARRRCLFASRHPGQSGRRGVLRASFLAQRDPPLQAVPTGRTPALAAHPALREP